MAHNLPPLSVQRSLKKLGRDMEIARRKRRIQCQVLADRAGISTYTLARIFAGDPGVSIGRYAAVIFALGFRTPFENLVDAAADEVGLALDEERLPKRIRYPREDS